MNKMMQDQEFLEYVVKALVDTPEAVHTERRVDEMGVLITLKVSPEDMGKIIGRNGATAKSIRSLLRVVGIKHSARVNLKIEEPEGGRAAPTPRTARTEGVLVNSGNRDLDDVIGDFKL
ncbi:MAG: KH domain-containing protein [Candidatus Sungbacteria bacterium]|nr:KH domain-containing protein [Candidatus Sungbacteria bacterium]